MNMNRSISIASSGNLHHRRRSWEHERESLQEYTSQRPGKRKNDGPNEGDSCDFVPQSISNVKRRKTETTYIDRVEQYLETNPRPDTLLPVLLNDDSFVKFLAEPGIKFHETCAILEVLARISHCSTDHARTLLKKLFVKMLPPSIESRHFLTTELLFFIAHLDHNANVGTAYANSFIDAINYLLVFLRKLQITLPTMRLPSLPQILPLLKNKICHLLVTGHNLRCEIYYLWNEINGVLEKGIEASSYMGESNGPGDERSNNFRSIEICPTLSDILTSERPHIEANKIEGGYEGGVEHYLDVQFRLLREDFIRPLRESIQEFNASSLSAANIQRNLLRGGHDIRLYQNVVIKESVLANQNILFNAEFNHRELQHVQWQSSKRMLTGSVVCLSYDKFTSFTVATVTGDRDPKQLEKGRFQITFEDDIKNLETYLKCDNLTMIESTAFYEAYKHNLKVLQSFDDSNFPLKRYIVDVERNIDFPPYLEEVYNQLFEGNLFGFDKSQYAAFKAALTKQLVIIQGPPGTGKTYLGLRIMQTLLTKTIDINRNWRFKFPPILVVCHTNHALDQFLEGMLQFTEKILRIGGRSNSDILHENNLSEVSKRSHFESVEIQYAIKMREKCIDKFESIKGEIGTLCQTNRILNNELLTTIQRFNVSQFNTLTDGFEDEICIENWLGLKLIGSKKLKIQHPQVMPMSGGQYNKRMEPGDDEDEVNYVQNMRLVNNEDVYLRRQGNIASTKTEEIRYEYEDVLTRQKITIHNELKTTDKMTIFEAGTVQNVWLLPCADRWRLYKFWISLKTMKCEKELEQARKEYLERCEILNAFHREKDIVVARQHDIIGMTTTGAAKYRHIIEQVKPKIVVVDEAAGVLEAHIVTALCNETEHLILMGDYQQLRPNPTVNELARKYKLETSLFERLIKNGMEYHQLKLQHRMRPEISNLLLSHFYRELQDHPSVKKYEHIKGVGCDMFFLNHNQHESIVVDTQSRFNDFEADFVVRFSKYLIQQGYDSSQIAVLTLYSAQSQKLKKCMRGEALLRDVRVRVVDSFQGEESDIIIISFVRSNDDGDLGFLNITNRINFALSRAKKGLFCVGNFDCLSKKSSLWKSIVENLRTQEAIGEYLPLYCQNHPTTEVKAKVPADFEFTPEGGCQLPCDGELICGHICPKSCHVLDPDHETIECADLCNRITCAEGHRCQKRCHFGKGCGDCDSIVIKTLPCAHEVHVKCSVPPSKACCVAPCQKMYPSCLHQCNQICGEKCDPAKCKALVRVVGECGHDITVECALSKEKDKVLQFCKERCGSALECGHTCKGRCSECKQGRLHMACMDKCSRTLVCGHLCKELCSSNCPPCKMPCINSCSHAKCQQICGEPCLPCMEPCDRKCEHLKCLKLCHELCDRDICLRPCTKLIACRHKCIGLCGEKCPKLCRICDQATVTKLLFGNENNPNARFIELSDCGHLIEVNGLLKWINSDTAAEDAQNGKQIMMQTCPKCNMPIRKRKFLCTVDKCLDDVESVKLQIIGSQMEREQKRKRLDELLTEFGDDLRTYMFFESGRQQDKFNRIVDRLSALLSEDRSLHSLLLIENTLSLCERVKELAPGAAKYCNDADLINISSWLNKFNERLHTSLSFLQWYRNTPQEINDITMELKLLELVATALKHLRFSKKNIEAQRHLDEAFKLAFRPGSCHSIIFTHIRDQLNKGLQLLNGTGIQATQDEMVLKAMNFKKGCWFKCSNGHIYCIASCCGAMAQNQCPECDSHFDGEVEGMEQME